MLSLKNHFTNQHPDFSVPGSLYYGYMDLTYFSVVPGSLKDRELKIAIVFLHEPFRFRSLAVRKKSAGAGKILANLHPQRVG